MHSTEFTKAFETLTEENEGFSGQARPAEGFHISEIWLSDGATYRALDGYDITTDGHMYAVRWYEMISDWPTNSHRGVSVYPIAMQLDVHAQEVVGCVIGPKFAPCRGVL